ncbi:MAG: GlxA family transcriptional regulator [Nocardioides sp.]
MTAHRVAIAIYPGVQPLDAVGPHEVFVAASRIAQHQARDLHYQVALVSAETEPVRSESGISVVTGPLPAADRVDTVLVAGGDGAEQASADTQLTDWLSDVARTTRVGSVCTGAFVLAAAGLLDDRRAATHWARTQQLARAYPRVNVDGESLFLCDRGVWTSAGVTAGIDLALAMVEEDLGAELAQAVARWLVIYSRRSGSQSQFATPVWTAIPQRAPIRDTVNRIFADPAADHSLATLARQCNLSVRHFQRTFAEEVGETPAQFIERVRVERGRRLLEATPDKLAAVARATGFGSVETLRRAFVRRVGVSPDEYRKRFSLRTAQLVVRLSIE